MKSNTPARVRFAPSPTGYMHLGSARTALYNYLLARQTGGQFIVRIEDTDQKRFVSGTEEDLLEGMRWMGISWDEGPDIGGPYQPYHQSERKDIYLHYARQLVEKGKAYYCFCSPERLERVRQEQMKQKEPTRYDGTCRSLTLDEAARRIANGERHVIRFKTPKEGTTTGWDKIRGSITVDNRSLDDFILVKSDGLALYHLAAMTDDFLMKITHVVRGSEWLSTFPLHVLIIRAFEWPEPEFVHLSLFLKPSGKGKMSKRESSDLLKDGHSIYIKDFKGLGYLPEALVNWVSLMGWSYDDHTEYFKLPDLVEKFSLEKLNPSPAAINFSKLDHFNGLHIRSLEVEDLADRIAPFFAQQLLAADKRTLIKLAPLLQERLSTLDEAVDFAGFFFRENISPVADELVAKGLTASESAEIARKALQVLQSLPTINSGEIEPLLRNLVDSVGLTSGQVFGVIRVAVTGQKVSPPLFESMEIIGREKVIDRLSNAISILETLSQSGLDKKT